MHGVCGACGSGITVDDGLIVNRDDVDLLAALEEIVTLEGFPDQFAYRAEAIAIAAIAKAMGEA